MIVLDTDVLVRYVTQDDPDQSPRANALIEGLSEEDPAFVPTVVRLALRRTSDGAELPDAVIAETAARAGRSAVPTFDARAARRAGMTLMEPRT